MYSMGVKGGNEFAIWDTLVPGQGNVSRKYSRGQNVDAAVKLLTSNAEKNTISASLLYLFSKMSAADVGLKGECIKP